YDNRKLGLPFFDLVLNPVFAEIEQRSSQPDAQAATEGTTEAAVGPVLQPALPTSTSSDSLTTSILNSRQAAVTNLPGIVSDLDIPDTSLFFIQPDQAPPVEPLILEPEV